MTQPKLRYSRKTNGLLSIFLRQRWRHSLKICEKLVNFSWNRQVMDFPNKSLISTQGTAQFGESARWLWKWSSWIVPKANEKSEERKPKRWGENLTGRLFHKIIQRRINKKFSIFIRKYLLDSPSQRRRHLGTRDGLARRTPRLYEMQKVPKKIAPKNWAYLIIHHTCLVCKI